LSQWGNLQMALGDLNGAIPLHIAAIGIRLKIGVPQAGNNVRQLTQIRSALGRNDFDAENLVADSLRRLYDLFDREVAKGEE
jgi:hypothetical protein